jgi:hypothetical protein
MIVEVPARFYADHLARECGKTGKILKSKNNSFIVDLDAVSLQDLISDADYYANIDDECLWNENRGLVLSARATLKRLKANK